MQFNYGNSANYLAGGAAIANTYLDTYNTSQETGTDVDKLVQAESKKRDQQRVNAINQVDTVGDKALDIQTAVKLTDMDAKLTKDLKKIKKPAQQMAGVLGAANAYIGYKKYSDDLKIDQQESAERKKWRADMVAANKSDRATLQPMEQGLKSAQQQLQDYLTNKDKPVASSSTSTSSSPSTLSNGLLSGGSSSLTGSTKKLADSIAGTESGSWGYDAFNQGGAKGGTKVLGKYGSHEQVFGKKLTDMTVGEVLQRQSGYDDYSISDQQWRDNGGLHAVGRYQFVGPTLKDEVSKMGLSMDTPFNEKTQDAIFLSHAKRIGNISPWIGPSQKLNPSEKAELNSIIAGL